MDDIERHYNINEVSKNGYYRIYYILDDDDSPLSLNILLLYRDGKIYDTVSKKQWSDNEIEDISLKMYMMNEQKPESCWISFIKAV
jgi:hypothetical protein